MSSTSLETFDPEALHSDFNVSHVADFESAYISLIIVPRGLAFETNL